MSSHAVSQHDAEMWMLVRQMNGNKTRAGSPEEKDKVVRVAWPPSLPAQKPECMCGRRWMVAFLVVTKSNGGGLWDSTFCSNTNDEPGFCENVNIHARWADRLWLAASVLRKGLNFGGIDASSDWLIGSTTNLAQTKPLAWR